MYLPGIVISEFALHGGVCTCQESYQNLHGQALDDLTFYYDIVSAATNSRHMILDVPFAAPIDVCGKLFEMTASRLRWR